jgi:hypothetical protein
VNQSVGEGDYQATWNATDKASGLYFARIQITAPTGKTLFSQSRKLLLVK